MQSARTVLVEAAERSIPCLTPQCSADPIRVNQILSQVRQNQDPRKIKVMQAQVFERSARDLGFIPSLEDFLKAS